MGQTRTPNDVVALCVELLRAVREQEFRARGGAARAASVDRAWRAWRTDLERQGPLELFVGPSTLRTSEDGPALGRGRLDELTRRLGERGLPWLRFEPGLDAPTYGALVSLLVAEPASVAAHGGPAGFLPERGVGIRLPASDARVESDGDEEKDEEDVAQADASEAAAGSAAGSAAGAEETGAVQRLRTCRDDDAYAATVAAVVRDAIDHSEAGDTVACREAVRALSEHAHPRGRRSEAQRRIAREALGELCTGKRLADLIERATSADRDENQRATEILLQLAGEVAPALLSAIDVQGDPQRREELLGITIALGRAATPALRRAMEGSSDTRARVAARIAGEIRDERVVPALARLLQHRDADVRTEAARALARVGSPGALEALSEGLASPHESVASLCAYCLGVTGSPAAAEALTETLRQSRRARRITLASAVIRSLGRLGREESVPELRRILQKRSLFRRHELQELKLQAVAALARLPGEPAREVLLEVASGSDMSLAVAARRAMNTGDDEAS